MVLEQLSNPLWNVTTAKAKAEVNSKAAEVGMQIVERAAEDVDGIARVVASPLVENRSFMEEAVGYLGPDIEGFLNAFVLFPTVTYATWAGTRQDDRTTTSRAIQAIGFGLLASFIYSLLWVKQL